MSKKKAPIPVLHTQVTTTTARHAYYGEPGQSIEVVFKPGDVGTVEAIDVPAVRAPVLHTWDAAKKTWKKVYPQGRNPVFACIDFWRHDQKWRVNLYYDQIVPAPLERYSQRLALAVQYVWSRDRGLDIVNLATASHVYEVWDGDIWMHVYNKWTIRDIRPTEYQEKIMREEEHARNDQLMEEIHQ